MHDQRHDTDPAQKLRIDKWLWAARFFKTRALAQAAVESGRVLVAGERVKASRALRLGDELLVRTGDLARTVIVLALHDRRGPASEAQALYEETQESVRSRVEALARRALEQDPAQAIDQGRPTKRDRRRIDRLRDGH